MLLLFLSVELFPHLQAKPEKIETKLSQAEGKERIKLLEEFIRNYDKKNPEKVIEYGKEALNLLKEFPDEKTHATILYIMSSGYIIQGKQQIAMELALESLSIAEKIKNKQIEAEALNSLGEVSIMKGELNLALEYYERNVLLNEELKDKFKQAKSLNSIGIIYWELGDYPKAIEYYINSLKVYEELNNQWGIALTNNNIGSVYWELGNADKSLEYYYKALEIFEKLKAEAGSATTLDNIGQVLNIQGKYEESLASFTRALQYSEELDNKTYKADILNHTGEVHKEQKNFRQALELFKQALEIKEELDDQTGIAELLINIASINQRLGQYQEAIEQANRGLAIAIEVNLKSQIRDAYQVLSETYEAMGDHKESLNYFKKFYTQKDDILNEGTTKKITDLQTNYNIERKQNEIELLKKDKDNQRMRFNFLIIFALLILLLAFVIYTRYRLKVRTSLALEKEIEERKLTELKLRESEEKFRVLAEKSLVGIWIIQDKIIKYANPRTLKIFCCSQEDIINKNLLEFVVVEDRSQVTEHLEKRMNGSDDTLSYEFKGISKDGDILNLESYGSLTLYQGKPSVLESVIDITRRKKTESELIKSRKMESVGILAGGIAHDFNNLLAVIIGNTSMMKLSFGCSESKMNNFLENVERASAQAAELAQKFITFSEGGWLMRKKVKLANILKDTEHLSPDIKNIPCEISIPADLAPIYGDERQLRQVITNLLLNAHESTTENNRKIIVNARNISLEKENQFSLKNGKYVKISVIDNGRGIPPELLEKIFDPYFSTKTTVSQKGLGMGLAICYSIVKKHGGHISITSEVQKGTTVDMYLPVYGT